jgi:hypothetical protein
MKSNSNTIVFIVAGVLVVFVIGLFFFASSGGGGGGGGAPAGGIATGDSLSGAVSDSEGTSNQVNSSEQNTSSPVGTGPGKQSATLQEDVVVFSDTTADSINASIKTIESTRESITVEFFKPIPSEVTDLAIGDKFCLAGDENTPFGEAFIGKVVGVAETPDGLQLIVENPSFDEVFSEFQLKGSFELNSADLVDVKVAPGVSIEADGADPNVIPASATPEVKESIQQGVYRPGESTPVKQVASSKGSTVKLKLSVNLIDMFKLLNQSVSFDEGTGNGFGVEKGEKPTAKLTGSIELKNLRLDSDIDFSWTPPKFEQLAFNLSGTYTEKIQLDVAYSARFKGEATKVDILNGLVKAEGLDKKVVPIAFLSYRVGLGGNFQLLAGSNGNKKLDDMTKTSPLTVGVIVFMDAEGKLSFHQTISYEKSHDFNYNLTLFKDGDWDPGFSNDKGNQKENIHIDTSLSADGSMTFLGVSAMAYIFNINIVEIGIIDLGLEGNIEAKYVYDSDPSVVQANDSKSGINGHARFYVKLGRIEVKCKLETKIFGLGTEFSWDKTLIDYTIFELPPPTDQVTAFVYDVSTSMDDPGAMGSKLEDAIRAGRQVALIINNTATQYGASTKAGVSSFSNSSYVNQGMTDDFVQIDNTLSMLTTISGTNMLAGLEVGLSELEGESSDNKVMIYLSDGMDTAGNSDAEILAVARRAKDANIKIYTIGFGDSSVLNEYLLEEIATTTGGQYSHADPSSAIDISIGFVKAQISSVATVLHETQGTVGQGETADGGTFEVTTYGNLQICTLWPGSTMDIVLTDPDGIQVTDTYPGYTVKDGDTIEQVFIENAKQGTWTSAVYGTDVSMSQEPFYTVVAFTEAPPVAPAVSGGGGAQDNSTGLLFLLVVVVILAIGGVAAVTMRQGKDEKK